MLEVGSLGTHQQTHAYRAREQRYKFPGIAWTVYGGDYNSYFNHLFDESFKNPEEFINGRPPGKRRILDLMGPGSIIKRLLKPSTKQFGNDLASNDGGIAVTLVDPYKDQCDIEENEKLHLRVVEADIYDNNTASQVVKCMREMSFEAFDLIWCRPDGPFKNIPDMKQRRAQYLRLFGEKLIEYASLLSEDGKMFTQIPLDLLPDEPTEDGRYLKLLDRLCGQRGFAYKIDPIRNKTAMRIEKITK